MLIICHFVCFQKFIIIGETIILTIQIIIVTYTYMHNILKARQHNQISTQKTTRLLDFYSILTEIDSFQEEKKNVYNMDYLEMLALVRQLSSFKLSHVPCERETYREQRNRQTSKEISLRE